MSQVPQSQPWDRLIPPAEMAAELNVAPSAPRSPWRGLQLPPQSRPWDRLILPAEMAAVLNVEPSAPSSPWGGLQLPRRWASQLNSDTSLSPAVQVPLDQPNVSRAHVADPSLPVERAAEHNVARTGNVRALQRCFCGLFHDDWHCDGIAFESALEFHRYCVNHPSHGVLRHSLGTLDSQVCPFCNSVQFVSERINCCFKGSVYVPVVEVPDVLHSAICRTSVLNSIRSYNMALSMASTGHQNLSPQYGMFVLGGKTYHRIASQFAHPVDAPGYAQIYILDTAAATARRLEIFSARPGSTATLDASILNELHDLLVLHNPWIGQYRCAGLNGAPELHWHSCGHVDVGGMGVGSVLQGYGARNIIVRHSDHDLGIMAIDDGHALYHPLAYVLLFPTGAAGWNAGLSRLNEQLDSVGCLTLAKWARFLIMRRIGGLSHLQSCGSLTCEFWCDVWSQVESRQLGFLRRADSQLRMRSGPYHVVDDAIERRAGLGQVGTPVWMPASFVGSAKWYQGLFHDAMMLPTHFEFPDLFITMTCNPKWEEILCNIPEGSDASLFPDIVSRVFYAKWQSLLHDIVDGGIFGKVLSFCWRIEWQFRGWPHVHCMIILANKLLSPHQIDGVVSAEIPDPTMHPLLHQLVCDFMIHGPYCGDQGARARCRQANPEMCKHRFPKTPQNSTSICSGQFPAYRRRCQHVARVRGHLISDEWVVPHNALLLLRYRCHINVEVCGHLKVMKYCFKYIFKRPDYATICIDEIDHYITTRVLSVGEAVWRLLGLKLHQEYPPVMRLDIHLPHQHRVTFDSASSSSDVRASLDHQTSTLMQWFKLNDRDTSARCLKYADVPGKYVWTQHTWKLRRKQCRTLGRIYMVGKDQSELFFLRRLLCVVIGARSFDDLLTVQNVRHSTFQDACQARGMLVDDAEYITAMQDIINVETSIEALRSNFACLIVRCRPSNSRLIFEMFLPDLCGVESPQSEDIDCTVWALECYANELGHSLQEFGWALPSLRMIIRQNEGNLAIHLHNRDYAFERFSDEQRKNADLILNAVEAGAGGVFYLQAAGGCGKSFWANGVSAALKVAGLEPMNVAASALAASLLHSGRTAHAALKIPLECSEASFCTMDAETRTRVIATECILWDECSMVHVNAANCVNRSLQDIMGTNQLFGGKVVCFMGDFQQLLPVVRHGNGDNVTIMRADWWGSVQYMHLHQNFRSNDAHYCSMLQAVGLGDLTTVIVPPECMAESLEHLVEQVFLGNYQTSGRHVVTSTLEAAAKVNAVVLEKAPGIAHQALSADTKINCRDDLYSEEYLHSLSFPGSPPAILHLKVGARYMLLRNLDPLRSLLNGTEVVMLDIHTYTVTVKLPSGEHVVLPRISFVIDSTVSGLPFTIVRRQFPIIPAYALTVHRVQGQTLKFLGLYITGDMFCHGMLYTCLSRVRSWQNVCVWCDVDHGPFELRNLVRPHIVAHLR